MPGAGPHELPEDFQTVLEGLRSVRVRPEVQLEEAPAPQKLAPFAVALSATVADGGPHRGEPASRADTAELAQGRLIVLCDPAGHEAWGGRLRVVTYIRAALEAEMITDPLVMEVAWGWLEETLTAHGVPMAAPGGTVTRVQSQPFGDLVDDEDDPEEPSGELEIRASWSPIGPVTAHVEAWIDVLCTAAGLPPPSPGVVPIPNRRPSRGC
jgi:hypothetical protein